MKRTYWLIAAHTREPHECSVAPGKRVVWLAQYGTDFKTDITEIVNFANMEIIFDEDGTIDSFSFVRGNLQQLTSHAYIATFVKPDQSSEVAQRIHFVSLRNGNQFGVIKPPPVPRQPNTGPNFVVKQLSFYDVILVSTPGTEIRYLMCKLEGKLLQMAHNFFANIPNLTSITPITMQMQPNPSPFTKEYSKNLFDIEKSSRELKKMFKRELCENQSLLAPVCIVVSGKKQK